MACYPGQPKDTDFLSGEWQDLCLVESTKSEGHRGFVYKHFVSVVHEA